jgi:hypothetical protein
MAIPWAAQQQDAELLQELATESLPLATIGLAKSLLHLQRQMLLELLDQELLAQKPPHPWDLRWFMRYFKPSQTRHTVVDTKRPQSLTGV